MPKDYKNLNRKKSGDHASGLRSFISFITGLTIGLFVAFVVYLKEHNYTDTAQKPNLVIQNKTQPSSKTDFEVAKQADIPEPKFDFYQILPNMEVNVSEWEQEQKDKNEPITQDEGVYILQVGSFEQYQAADELKAKLALLGINADIQRVVINGKEVRHRVRIGPYKDPTKLQEARDRLLENKLDFMLLKLKVDDIKP